MTPRDHLEVRKWGVKGPPILCSKIGLPWDILENLWSKIWGALNPPFSHLQMIPLGHMNIPTGLFLDFNLISIHPFWLISASCPNVRIAQAAGCSFAKLLCNVAILPETMALQTKTLLRLWLN